MKKTTLMILAVSAILGAMLVGCSKADEGNTDPGATATSTTGGKDTKPMAGAPVAPKTDDGSKAPGGAAAGNTPAAGNEPAKK